MVKRLASLLFLLTLGQAHAIIIPDRTALLSGLSALFIMGCIFVGSVGLYFLPTIVASCNKECRNTTAVFVMNLLLGWTLIGWVVALVMAVWQSAQAQPQLVQTAVHPQPRMFEDSAATTSISQPKRPVSEASVDGSPFNKSIYQP